MTITATPKAKKAFSVSIKEIAPDGSFEGLLAVYNNKDLGGDLIEPGAFTKTIKENGPEVVLLWQHKSDRPIGTLQLIDSPTALKVKGQIAMEVPDGLNAYRLIKAKVIKGMSIGYDTIKDQVENGVRLLKEVRLWEGSIVTFPMNTSAMITSVKHHGGNETKGDFSTELSQIQLQEAGYQMRYALFNALGSIVWASGMTTEDKVAAAQTSIDQFTEAFMEYFPQYLAWLAVEFDMEMMGRLQMEEKDMGAILSRNIKSVVTLRKLKAGVITPEVAAAELKEGRKISAATKKSVKAMHDHMKSATDICCSLLDDEAEDDDNVDDTSKTAAVQEVKTAEPVEEDHSEAIEILTGLRSLIRGA
jgi:HK97 family phage prohead protease